MSPDEFRAFTRVAALASVLLLLTTNAHAYLDPGSGSLLIQALIAGFLGASYYVATSWKKIKAFFQSRRSKTEGE